MLQNSIGRNIPKQGKNAATKHRVMKTRTDISLIEGAPNYVVSISARDYKNEECETSKDESDARDTILMTTIDDAR